MLTSLVSEWRAGCVCCVQAGTVGEREDQVPKSSLQHLLRGNQMVHSPHSPTAITSSDSLSTDCTCSLDDKPSHVHSN